jgi:hypothetical protein
VGLEGGAVVGAGVVAVVGADVVVVSASKLVVVSSLGSVSVVADLLVWSWALTRPASMPPLASPSPPSERSSVELSASAPPTAPSTPSSGELAYDTVGSSALLARTARGAATAIAVTVDNERARTNRVYPFDSRRTC